ncbi:L-ascorbate metabolism protein UlaG, beta-lactamase superfamily [Streptomyces sp. DvalAA-14]|uniref:MBL fold metallo-hydrolase n=1 Tax=unclassified Streptomyces TaxID=2593676 RepID=UPI00081B35BB|nr:MBL fold metallo-hydrolase [Streptomyces sp. DvalAA-14]MYS21901.1 MBL fold metallo-hydrolase [Streptomyces sp. SID4948]SCE03774.1 L-ascorbate metabolism protein UlaG, beta-lactamase superfamily [Streptomyces sp. DvalAA-14]
MAVEITWWGHATVTVRDGGVRVLTDPLFARRLAHLRRRRGAVPPPVAAEADVVLVSHLHADHLHLGSLRRLAPGTTVLLPAGALAAVPGLRRLRDRLRLVEVAAGESLKFGELAVRAVPAAHDGRRLPYGPRRVSPLGYVLTGSARTYFAGDTGLFDAMAEEVGPCDVALLPVGGWGPFLGPGHLDPERAARALAALAPRAAVPVHYGTYWPIGLDGVRPHEFHTPGAEFVRLAARIAPGVAVHRLEHGQSVLVPDADRHRGGHGPAGDTGRGGGAPAGDSSRDSGGRQEGDR